MLKKILNLIFCIFLLISCAQKPLYLQGDVALAVNVQTQVSIQTVWNAAVQSKMIYQWNDNVYGPIEYTPPTHADIVIFNNNDIVQRKTIKTGVRELIDVELDKTYDFLIFNKTDAIEDYYLGGRYLISASNKSTKGSIDGEWYEPTKQPGEIFSTYQQNIFLSSDVTQYEETYENGKLIYVYNIDADLKPVSYIYVIQFMIVKDDSTEIRATGISDYSISGISTVKNLFTENPVYSGKKEITSNDVKPGQMVADSLVFASKFTILDLGTDDESSSWTDAANFTYYCTLTVNTETDSFTGTVNITDQMKKQSKGGVITVRIKNSALKDKTQPSGGGGFNAEVENWQQEEEIEIII